MRFGHLSEEGLEGKSGTRRGRGGMRRRLRANFVVYEEVFMLCSLLLLLSLFRHGQDPAFPPQRQSVKD